MKMRKILEPVVFGLLAIPVAYIAISLSVGHFDKYLAQEATKLALIHGSVLGVLLALTLFIFQLIKNNIPPNIPPNINVCLSKA